MVILSDTDIVHKLACCELLLDFLQYIECPPNDVWVLPQLDVMMKRKLAQSSGALANYDQFKKKVQRIPQAKLDTLERFDTLDPGEQQLLAILCDEPRVEHLVTGDKRALDRIAALTFGDEQLKTRLHETSVFCFEAIFLGLLKKRGFSIMRARVQNKWAKLPGQKVDGVVERAFPEQGDAELAERVLAEELALLRVGLPPIQFAAA